MARVPSANQQVRTNPLQPGFQSGRGASAAAFGAREGQAKTRLGQTIQKQGDVAAAVSLGIQEDENIRNAKELDNEFSERKRELLQEFDGLQGKDRVEAGPRIVAELNKLSSEFSDRAPNRRVREMFTAQARSRLNGDLDRIASGVSEARFQQAESVGEARQANAVADMAADYTNTKTINQGLAILTNEVMEQGDRNGWDDEVTAARLRQVRTVALDQTVTAALNQGDTEIARAVLDQYRDKIDGPTIATLTKSINNQEAETLEQTDTQSVLDRFGDKTSDAHKFIRKTWTGSKRDRRISRYNARVAEIKADREGADDAALTNALDHVRANGKPEDIQGDVKQRLIDAGHWKTVMDTYERVATGTQKVTDQTWMHENFWSLTADQQRRVPLTEIAPHVSTEDFRTLEAERREGTKPFFSQTESQYITSRMKNLELDATDDDDRKTIDRFHRDFEERVNQVRLDKGRKATEAERRQIINDLTIQVKLDSNRFSFGDRSVSAFQANEAQTREALRDFDVLPRIRVKRLESSP